MSTHELQRFFAWLEARPGRAADYDDLDNRQLVDRLRAEGFDVGVADIDALAVQAGSTGALPDLELDGVAGGTELPFTIPIERGAAHQRFLARLNAINGG